MATLALWDVTHTGADAMIIQCPNCGFSGRVPSDAIGSQQHARCPQCRFRFDLASYEPDHGFNAGMDLASRGMFSDPEDRDVFDPASSSYELKAIPDEDRGQPLTAGTADPRNEASQVPNSSAVVPAAPAEIPLRGLVGQGTSVVETSAARPEDPWYALVLQVWGAVFLAWAGILMVRSVFLMVSAPADSASRADLIPTIVALLLLVPGAAGVFVLVDLGRYIRGLGPVGFDRPRAEDRPVPSLPLAPRRFWRSRHAAFRFLSARPG
jgi:hypothetical protein